MKNAIQLTVCLTAAGLVALGTACTKPPAPVPVPEPEAPKVPVGQFIGFWEGATRKGETCTIRFTATDWECNLEEGGVARPYYRGTYIQTGFRVDMTITQEGDLKTMDWVGQKGNLGPKISGRLAGGKLTVDAFSAELTKKR